MRWVHDEGLHLTLKFFGEVAPDRLDVIEEAAPSSPCRDTGPLGLSLGEPGAFPSAVRPRVALARRRRRRRRWSCCRTGWSAAPRRSAFLRRARRSGPTSPWVGCGRDIDFRAGAGGLQARRTQPAPFLGEQLVLYESVLTTQGPRYEPRLTLELAA